jgi:hypothetical protein
VHGIYEYYRFYMYSFKKYIYVFKLCMLLMHAFICFVWNWNKVLFLFKKCFLVFCQFKSAIHFNFIKTIPFKTPTWWKSHYQYPSRSFPAIELQCSVSTVFLENGTNHNISASRLKFRVITRDNDRKWIDNRFYNI